MDTPISDFTKKYASSDTARFHMPGHKGVLEGTKEDITEISGADSLYEASGIILKSEKNASGLFGSAATYYSTEGSSQCIRAMLALVTQWKNSSERQMILATRNVHRSFLTAAALLDIDVEWLYPENKEYSLCRCDVSAGEVAEHIMKMPVKPAAVYLTSPDYLGGMQDVEGIAKAAHKAGIPLIVDNAHGSYLRFLEPSLHPLDLGADLCCDSAHKTLPALTGCAYLHVSNESEYKEFFISNARRALALFGSTSPSYLMLKSLDETNKVLASCFRKSLNECSGAVISCRRKLARQGWNMFDVSEPLKITINAAKNGICGSELARALRNNGIECEYSDPDYVVLMPSPYNKNDLERLTQVMGELACTMITGKYPELTADNKTVKSFPLVRPEKVMTVREAMLAPTEEIASEVSNGRILADASFACPPAVVPIVCGERIPEEAIEIFDYYGMKTVVVTKEL